MVIYNIYHGGNIETSHHVLFLMPEDVANNYVLPNFAIPGLGALRGVLDNYITTRDQMSLNGLWVKKLQSMKLFVMLQI